MKAALILALVAGCAAYTPGSFSHYRNDFPGKQTTVGCLDLAVDSNDDEVATGAIARFSIGNRCDRAALVDFTQVVARYRDAGGEWNVVSPTDPRAEIRPARLEARSVAVEYFEYLVPEDAGSQLCFDLSRLTEGAGGTNELCLETRTAEVTQ